MVVVAPDFVGKPAPKPAPQAEEKKTKKSGK